MSVLIDIATGDPNDAAKRFQTAAYMDAYGKSADAVSFEAAGHIYRFKATGAIVPGVTHILKATGMSLDFEHMGLGRKVEHAVQLKRDIGSALHADTHAYDDNDLVWETVNEEVRPFLECWVTFRDHYPFLRPATRERLVYHPGYRYAGTLDGIFLYPHESNADIEITERWSVQLIPGKRIPYQVKPYEDHYHDLEVWRSVVTTFHHQHGRRAA